MAKTLSEYKKQIGIAVTIALVGALALGFFANSSFPSQTAGASSTTMSGVTAPASVVPLVGELFARNVSCSIATGVCSFTIVNNSSTPLQPENCRVLVTSGINVTTTTYTTTSLSFTTYTTFANASSSTHTTSTSSSSAATGTSTPSATTVTVTATVTTVRQVNGTIGGPAVAGIPANSQVDATCAVPTSQLAHETKGSSATGNLVVKFADSKSHPAGAGTTFGFEGIWS